MVLRCITVYKFNLQIPLPLLTTPKNMIFYMQKHKYFLKIMMKTLSYLNAHSETLCFESELIIHLKAGVSGTGQNSCLEQE
jgi:hypothetical protein